MIQTVTAVYLLILKGNNIGGKPFCMQKLNVKITI
jgi:hypothetical protein